MDRDGAVYIIGVAARMVDMHPSTLRKYERMRLIEPSRSTGRQRLYSPKDISRLQQIKYLVDERGVNLAGVELALETTAILRRLQEVLAAERDGVSERQEATRYVLEALALLGAR